MIDDSIRELIRTETQGIVTEGGIIVLKDGTHIIYEPLGILASSHVYLWYCCDGRKNISLVKEVKPKDDKGEEIKNAPSTFEIEMAGKNFQFEARPMRITHRKLCKLLHTPSMDVITQWVENKIETKTGPELFRGVTNYFKLFGDYQHSYDPYLMTLQVFETYFMELLNTVFYLTIKGAFNSGKTTLLDAMAEIAYRGLSGDSISPPFRVRFADAFKPAWYQDELDQTERKDDGLSFSMLRTSYKRGAVYGRWNAEKNEPDLIEHFAALVYTVYADLEDGAMRSRSLASIYVTKSIDYKVPVINTLRQKYSAKLSQDLFFWRIGEIDKAIHKGIAQRLMTERDDLDKTISQIFNDHFDREAVRKEIYEKLTSVLNPKEKKLLEFLTGRDAQLAYVAAIIQRITAIDVVDYLIDAINVKLDEEFDEPEELESELIDLLKTHVEQNNLVKKYEHNEQITEDAILVPLTKFTTQLHEYVKEHKLKKDAGGKTIAAWLRDIGFSKENGTKKRKSGKVMLYFKESVAKSLMQQGEPPQIDKNAFSLGIQQSQYNNDDRTIKQPSLAGSESQNEQKPARISSYCTHHPAPCAHPPTYCHVCDTDYGSVNAKAEHDKLVHEGSRV